MISNLKSFDNGFPGKYNLPCVFSLHILYFKPWRHSKFDLVTCAINRCKYLCAVTSLNTQPQSAVMATKEDNRRCACFAKPIGILQFVDTKEKKKKNTETEPILRLVLPTGGGPSNKGLGAFPRNDAMTSLLIRINFLIF